MEEHIYKLAIVIPCWNCEIEIKEMLDSIILQTFQEWQVFCVDDQSTDNTLKVLEDYSQKDNRINYIVRSRLPKGAQTCRNIGLEYSIQSKYVIFFDADDRIAPYCLEQRVKYMEAHPDLDFGIFPAKTFLDAPWDKGNGCCYGFPFFEDSLGAMLNWTLPMVVWTNIYRSSSLKKYKIEWDTKIMSMQDSDFNIQTLIKGMRYDYAVKMDAKIDYFYRKNHNSAATSRNILSKEHFNSHIYLLDKITKELSKKQKKDYKSDLKRYFFSFARIIKSDVKSYNIFIQLDWIKSNKTFYFQLYLWKLFHFRYERYIFHTIRRDNFLIHQKWKDMMKKEMNSYTNTNNREITNSTT